MLNPKPDWSRVQREGEFFLDNLLVRIHLIIVMIKWTGLAPWEFKFPNLPTNQLTSSPTVPTAPSKNNIFIMDRRACIVSDVANFGSNSGRDTSTNGQTVAVPGLEWGGGVVSSCFFSITLKPRVE